MASKSHNALKTQRTIPNLNSQRFNRKLGPTQFYRQNNSRRIQKPAPPVIVEEPLVVVAFHPWNAQYRPINLREPARRPMTKDPYRQYRLNCVQATESIVTEEEYSLDLISPTEVQIDQPVVHQPTPGSVRSSVRYLHGDEMLPSGHSVATVSSKRTSQSTIRRESQITSSIHSTAKTLATAVRLLDRAKGRNEQLTIRRPPRRLLLNFTYETIMPLSVFG